VKASLVQEGRTRSVRMPWQRDVNGVARAREANVMTGSGVERRYGCCRGGRLWRVQPHERVSDETSRPGSGRSRVVERVRDPGRRRSRAVESPAQAGAFGRLHRDFPVLGALKGTKAQGGTARLEQEARWHPMVIL